MISALNEVLRRSGQPFDDDPRPGGSRRWHTVLVRLSHFWMLMTDEFGSAYANTLARDHVLGSLGNRTAQQALDEGDRPRDVWTALCDDMDVPSSRRLGADDRAAPGAAAGPRAPK